MLRFTSVIFAALALAHAAESRTPASPTPSAETKPQKTETIRVKRAEIEKAVRNLSQELNQARVEESKDPERPKGVIVVEIAPKSFFARSLKIKKGDLLVEVDGVAVNEKAKLTVALQKRVVQLAMNALGPDDPVIVDLFRGKTMQRMKILID
jgi:S1-C subfamily serine protease